MPRDESLPDTLSEQRAAEETANAELQAQRAASLSARLFGLGGPADFAEGGVGEHGFGVDA